MIIDLPKREHSEDRQEMSRGRSLCYVVQKYATSGW